MSEITIVTEPTEVTGSEPEIVTDDTSTSSEGFSIDSVPWMKLGKIENGEPKTAAEAAALSGLNFDVRLFPVEYTRGDGTRCQYADRFTVERDDTNVPLGIVSGVYEPVQYREAFSFMDSVSPKFVAAGSLNGGKQGFMVVDPEIELNVLDGDDSHKLYAVLRTSHDRTRALEVCVMPLRHRCMNQLPMRTFAHQAPHRWSLRHTTNIRDKMTDAKFTIDSLRDYATVYEQTAEKLASITVSDENAERTIRYILPSHVKKTDDVVSRILSLVHNDPRVGYEGTGWGLIQGISTYYDHERAGGSPQSRFLAALQGQTINAVSKASAYVITRLSR